MLRRAGVLVVLTSFLATGCIDGIEWESSGFPVEEVRHTLEDEHHAENPTVECIKREVGGAVWECRAHTADAAYKCEVKVGPREVIHELECESEEEEAPAAKHAEEPAELSEDPGSTVEHDQEPTPAPQETHTE